MIVMRTFILNQYMYTFHTGVTKYLVLVEVRRVLVQISAEGNSFKLYKRGQTM